MKPRRLFTHGVEAVALDPPDYATGAQDWLAGYLCGAAQLGDLDVESHDVNGRPVPSFTVTVGAHQLVVHVDQVIA